MKGPLLHEFFADPAHEHMAVAWDRDVPANHRWVTDDDDCRCSQGPHLGPRVTSRSDRITFVTDGHGTGFRWIPDPGDPLGGHWSGTIGQRSHRIVDADCRPVYLGSTEVLK